MRILLATILITSTYHGDQIENSVLKRSADALPASANQEDFSWVDQIDKIQEEIVEFVSPPIGLPTEERGEQRVESELLTSDIFDSAPFNEWSMQKVWVDDKRYIFYGYRSKRLGCKADSSFNLNVCGSHQRVSLDPRTEKYYEKCYVKTTDLGTNNSSGYMWRAMQGDNQSFVTTWVASTDNWDGGSWIWFGINYRYIQRNAPREIREKYCNIPGDEKHVYRANCNGYRCIKIPGTPWDVGANRPQAIPNPPTFSDN